MTDPSSKADRAWATAAWGALVAILLFGGLLGFVIVPAIQARSLGIDPWTAICRAAGLRPASLAYASAAKIPGALPVSEVTWDPRILGALVHADRRDGARLAASACSDCHGEAGVSENPQIPFLADQSATAIYKQLEDYRGGARVSPNMSVVKQLSERQMLDLAAYYAHDDAVGALGRRWSEPDRLAERLALEGDPARNLPSCNACHGAGVGGPIETPTLVGQHEEYILRQLQLYASGERRNDVYGRMRNVARRLTPDEMARLATYYQGLR